MRDSSKRTTVLLLCTTLIAISAHAQIPLEISALNSKKKPPPPPRATEWKTLPKQSWEIVIPPPENTDPMKEFDAQRGRSSRPLGVDPVYFPSTDKLDFLGEIVGANTEREGLSLGDLVFIASDQKLKIGETYSLTSDPTVLKSPKSGRKGYSYLLSGKVKIIALRDDLYVGRIIDTKNTLFRGYSLIPVPPRIVELHPLAGPQALEATLMIDHRTSTYSTAQYKEVFIDKGSDDGLKAGMVFRSLDHFDPSNKKKIADIDLSVLADILVTQVSQKFSTGFVIHSHTAVSDFSPLTLLTDISDLKKFPDYNEFAGKGENLDQLDDGKKLTPEERNKLLQMKDWKENPNPSSTPNPEATSSPFPEASLIPPEAVFPGVSTAPSTPATIPERIDPELDSVSSSTEPDASPEASVAGEPPHAELANDPDLDPPASATTPAASSNPPEASPLDLPQTADPTSSPSVSAEPSVNTEPTFDPELDT